MATQKIKEVLGELLADLERGELGGVNKPIGSYTAIVRVTKMGIFTIVAIEAIVDALSIMSAVGISRKSHLDSFNEEAGVQIAKGRALESMKYKIRGILDKNYRKHYRCAFAG